MNQKQHLRSQTVTQMLYLTLSIQTLPLNEVHQKIVTEAVVLLRRGVVFWKIATVGVLEIS